MVLVPGHLDEIPPNAVLAINKAAVEELLLEFDNGPVKVSNLTKFRFVH